jgi:hypothetical protein
MLKSNWIRKISHHDDTAERIGGPEMRNSISASMNIKTLIFIAGSSLSSLFLSGCFYPGAVPEGTVRITGGSGESVEAGAVFGTGITPIGGGLTTIQTTVNLNLKGEKVRGFEGLTYGQIKATDLAFGLNVEGTVVAVLDGTNPSAGQVRANQIIAQQSPSFGPGVGVFCIGRAKGADQKWFPVEIYLSFEQDPFSTVPGDSDLRHVVGITVFAPDNSFYSSLGFFIGGNFVFHGEKGVILR